MKNLFILILVFIALSCEETATSPDESPLVVMAYYVPERDYQPEKIPVEKLTHIIFSFTNVIDGEMKFRNPDDQGPKLQQLVKQRERNPTLKVMIACGGWGADGFSDMALTAESRKKFAKSAAAFVREYDLDGLDMDWEYPGISGAGTKARDEDESNFTLLMKELRTELDLLERPQTLTYASAGWMHYYDYIQLEEVMTYADYMNIMTYDQVSGVSMYTGHHTPLGRVTEEEVEGTPFKMQLDTLRDAGLADGWTIDAEPRSIEKIVDYLKNEGVDPEQMVVGAAFYGRVWKGVPPIRDGLYQLSEGLHIGWYAYSHIREKYEPDSNFVRYWDDSAKAAFFYNQKDSLMVSYDDTVSVRLKTEYAADNGLGGIMFWELGNDTKQEGGLLDAIHAAAISGQ